MNTLKKLFTLLLALATILSLAVPAMATAPTNNTDEYQVTINDVNDGHTYEAYQIFSGRYNPDTAILDSIGWGSNFNKDKTADFLVALKANRALLSGTGESAVNIFAAIAAPETGKEDDTAMAIAKVLTAYNNDHTYLQEFAKVLHHYTEADDEKTYTYLTGKPKTSVRGGDDKTYVITGLKAGYYMIKDQDDSIDKTYDYYTRLILHVASNTTVSPKGGLPTVGKTVHSKPDQTFKDYEDVAFTDTIYFKLEGTLPSNYDKYEEYTYEFVDTMSSGLDLSEELYPGHAFAGLYSIVIERVGSSVTLNTTLNKTNASDDPTNDNRKNLLLPSDDVSENDPDVDVIFKAEKNTDGSTTIRFKFVNLKKSLPNLIDSDKIIIKYAAKLNENAIIGGGEDNKGNKNKVDLYFSNNPHGDGTGKTPEAIAEVFTFNLGIHKVDETGKELSGAKFLLYQRFPIGLTNQFVYKYAVFEKNNGVYTVKDWVPVEQLIQNQSKDIKDRAATPNYAVTEKGELILGSNYGDSTNYCVTADGKVLPEGADGYREGIVLDKMILTSALTDIQVKGLDSASYWLHEIEAPASYNRMTEDVEVVIEAGYDDATDTLKSLVVKADGSEGTTNLASGLGTITVQNTKGTTLPSTGGIGTTIFYVVGGLLAVAAIVLLVTKKRMAEK